MKAKQLSAWACDACSRLFVGEDGRTRAEACCTVPKCLDCGVPTGASYATRCRACKNARSVERILAGELGELVPIEDLRDDAAFFELDDHELYDSLEEWVEREAERLADELSELPAGHLPSAQVVLCVAEPIPWRPNVESWLENEEEEYLMGTDVDRFVHHYAEEVAKAQAAIDRIYAPAMVTDSLRFVDVRPLHEEIWDFVQLITEEE